MHPHGLCKLSLLVALLVCVSSSAAPEQRVQEIAIVHLSRTDFGFTDHPAGFAE